MDSNDPLHGVTLKALLEELVARYEWTGLAERIAVDCFKKQPSIKSSLKFLRKTPWARAKVEQLFVADRRTVERKRKRNQRRSERRRRLEAVSTDPDLVADSVVESTAKSDSDCSPVEG